MQILFYNGATLASFFAYFRLFSATQLQVKLTKKKVLMVTAALGFELQISRVRSKHST